MPISLKLVRKIAVVGKVRRDGIIPYTPLVGERSVVCRADRRLMAVLDRDSLDVVLSRGRFTVTDEATGAMLVDRRHPQLSEMFQEWPGSVLGDLAIFPSQSTHLAALDLRTGDLVYVKHHKRVAFWGTAVADGRLLAAGTDGNLWIYEAA